MPEEDTILSFVCRKCGCMNAKDEAWRILNKTCICTSCDLNITKTVLADNQAFN